MKKIAVLTSGGDNAGLNACINAIYKSAKELNIEVFGALHGYNGLLNNEFIKLSSQNTRTIIGLGGTVLKTSRSKEFMTLEGRQKAFENLKNSEIDGLIVIGGNGSLTGLNIFANEFNFPCIGIPGTIDNDLGGTDYTIGFDTAVNVALECIEKIQDTAESHNRVFFIEVMGRDAGDIALMSGMASGADAILIPEEKTSLEELYSKIQEKYFGKDRSFIVIVAEGEDIGNANYLSQKVKEKFPDIDTKVTILGHVQRGGRPTYFDRILALRLGYAAVKALENNETNIMVGVVNNNIIKTPLAKVITSKNQLSKRFVNLVRIFAN